MAHTVFYIRPFSHVGEHKSLLELCIPSTGERNVYTLLGKAADPVAEAHIVIECQARKTAIKNIAVRAYTWGRQGAQTYSTCTRARTHICLTA